MYTIENSPGRWLSALHRYAQSFICKRLRNYDIGSGQYIFLMELYKGDGKKQEELATALNIDKGTTAKALSNLEKHGYLTRETDKDDKRAYRIFLTNKAFNVKPYIHQVLLEWTEIITSGLSEKEAETALDLLPKMAANAVSFDRKS